MRQRENTNKMADLKPIILIITLKVHDLINTPFKTSRLSDPDMLSIRNCIKHKDTNESKRMKKDTPHRHYSK